MIWFFILYALGSLITTVFTICCTCVYDKKDLDLSSQDILMYVIMSMVLGSVWPLTWVYIGFMTLAKSLYAGSKKKFDEDEKLKGHTNG